MKPGARALGVAESFDGDRSTLAGAVVRASRVVEDLAFAECAVGGSDATDAVVSLYADVDREDVQYVLVAGIAPAWFNVVDLRTVARETDRPALSVSFEDSPGLSAAIEREFSDAARDRRLATYRDQPPRRRIVVGDGRGDGGGAGDVGEGDADGSDDGDHGTAVWVRGVGRDGRDAAEHPDLDLADVVRSFTPAGWHRPEPLRVAKVAARAGDAFRRDLLDGGRVE
ncbi:MAG: DUF99 family protein [Halobacteriaceae archaeon]